MKFANLLMMDLRFFLDISKAFYWHQSIILKLKQNGILSDLLNILSGFLSNWKQKVVFNRQASSWIIINVA